MTFTINFFSIFLEEKLKSMAFFVRPHRRRIDNVDGEKSGYRGSLDPYFPFGRCSAGRAPRQKLQN
jgi:hypothetical protein